MDAKARARTITVEVSESLRGSGVEVDDVTVQQAGKRRLVRVFLARALGDAESDDGTTPIEPLSLDEVAEATRTVSSVLDESDVMGEAPYTLEVSSAGLDRPLTAPAHFRRNVGRLLKVHLADDTTTTGRLLRSDADGILLGDPADERALTWSEVTKAVVQVEFSRPDRKDS
ncbi:ribosome maturation factor RimP [Ornithinimicrobium panacihumi]|uniref:ribosome maturation factor RimP n=1 Tax=Ornithinimicrobium panacihumi TaxID=2008449 RepID=UPI003F898AB8